VAIVAVAALSYPLVVLARRSPRFPSREECIVEPVPGEPVDLVWGRFDDPVTSADFAAQVVSVGFEGTESLGDGCGRWKVVLEDVPSIEVAREVQEEAATVDLAPTIERAIPS
jgi:hypothetical protein